MRKVSPGFARCLDCQFVSAVRQELRARRPPIRLRTLQLRVGDIIRDRFRLVGILGSGAHGATFLAEHLLVGHPCVVKALPHKVAEASDSAAKRMRAEARAGFRVNHTGVVRTLDADFWEGVWYFVMEFIDGVDLGELAAAREAVPWRQAQDLALQATSALAAIHRERLMHRDIKPGNLLLGADGRLRVADLGVAAFTHDAREHTVSLEKEGTFQFAAPELSLAEGHVDERSDLYSLGVTLFHLITGRAPFGEAHAWQHLLDAHNRQAHWPSEDNETPKWFRDVVLRLLELDPDDRFASAEELALAITGDRDSVVKPSSPQLQPRGVAIPAFINDGPALDEDEGLGQVLADHVTRALTRSGVYVPDRAEFERRLTRSSQGGGKLATLLEVGRLLGAGVVLQGRYQRSEGSITLEATAIAHGPQSEVPLGRYEGNVRDISRLEAALLERTYAALGIDKPDRSSPNPSFPVTLAAERRFFIAKQAFHRGDYEEALRIGRELAQQAPDYAEVIGLLGACLGRLGRYQQAEEQHRALERIALQRGDMRLKVEADANLGAMHYFRGDYETAETYFERAAEETERLGMVNEGALIRNNLGFVLIRLGRLAAAEQAFQRAIETHQANGALTLLIAPYNGMGNVMREQKRFDEARDYYRKALRESQATDDRVNEGISHLNLGQCAATQGKTTEARTELAMALTLLEETAFWNGLARVYESIAEMNARDRAFDESLRAVDKRIELARLHQNQRMEAGAWAQRGDILEQAGRRAEAEACRAHAAGIASPAAAIG